MTAWKVHHFQAYHMWLKQMRTTKIKKKIYIFSKRLRSKANAIAL